MEGSISGSTAALYRTNRQAQSQAVSLQNDATNNPIPRSLKLTDLNGGTYQVSVTLRKLVMKDTDPTHSDFLLELAATDYRIESQTLKTITITLPQSGGVTFPITFPITFGSSSGGSGLATNAGTLPASPTITITGPCINPVITNSATGERFGLSLTLVAGDLVTIDCKNRTVVQGTVSGLGGVTNRMGAKTANSTFFDILPGDNTILFSADTYDTGTATLSFRDAYAGI